MAEAIVKQFPVAFSAKDISKVIKDHVDKATHFLLEGQDHVPEFSSKQSKMAYRTLYGLARAVLQRKHGDANSDRETIQYPVKYETNLTAEITKEMPLTTDALTGCLTKALKITQDL
jgi:hypothetical protein